MQIPNKAIKPIPADIEKLKPVIRRAAIPPTAANGTFSNTSPASLALEKRINRIMKIMAMLIGTTCARRFEARCWFSKSPVHFKEYPAGKWTEAFTFFCASATAVPISRPLTENLTAQKRAWLSRKINNGPVIVVISASSLIGTIVPSIAGTSILPISSSFWRNSSLYLTIILNFRSSSYNSEADFPPIAISMIDWTSSLATP